MITPKPLVTGATGMIGSYTVRLLLRAKEPHERLVNSRP
jgi:uncharacterized protein YbjT (DUF2867 family)